MTLLTSRFYTLFPLFFLLMGATGLTAQTSESPTLDMEGSVHSLEQGELIPLVGATIQLFLLPDSSRVRGTATARDGSFSFNNLEEGDYLITVSYLGYETENRQFQVQDSRPKSFDFRLQPTSLRMQDLHVTSRRPRVEARGDTTAFHSEGYRTRANASAEELITRMPGFLIENGQVQAQGEEVTRVLVDGEEFFGDDALLTLRNLPADIIEQIEVYDRQSDQAQFTGFEDSNTERTVNIVTKRDMNRGRFGRGTTGYGSETRYAAGGNYNLFDDSRRISLIGMSNNINQQNFSSEDLLGVSQGGGGRGGGRGSTRGFRIGSRSGLSTVHSSGINYVDKWGDQWDVNGSYFFNLSDNTNEQNRERRYLTGSSADQIYNEQAHNTSDNYNHRLNMRIEHDLDDRRSLILTPRLSFQRNESRRILDGRTTDDQLLPLNEIDSENSSRNSGYDVAGSLLYRHQFETRGRTFSIHLRSNVHDRTGKRYQYDESLYYGEESNQITNDRQTELITGGSSFSGDLSYTEPVGENTQLMLSYQPSLDRDESVQDAFQYDDVTGRYSLLDTTRSNRYENLIFTHQGQGSFRFRTDNVNASVGLSLQQRILEGEQVFPVIAETSKEWWNLLPNASLRYRFNDRANLRLSYRSGTRSPSARQLQDVIDDSDPLRLTGGNPDLNQQYDHTLSLRFRRANPERGASTSFFVSAGYTTNHIGNRTVVATQDTLLQGVTLGRGSRLITPDNIGNSWNVRAFLNRGIPFDPLQSNLNLNGGLTYSQRPSMMDNERNLTDNLGLHSALSVNSNLSEAVDFRISYRAGYTIVKNSIRPELDNNYYNGRLQSGFDLTLWDGLLLGSDLNMTHYAGLSDDYNESPIYWTGYAGYRLLDNRAELKLTLFDILAQNDSINRTISEDYIEDYRTNVLSRYLLLTFTYNFRSFPGRGS